MKNLKMAKKILSGMIAMSCVMGSTIPFTNSVLATENTEFQYAEMCLGKLLCGTEYESMEDISISSSFEVKNSDAVEDNESLYVVYHEQEVIGIMNIQESNNSCISTYQEGDFPVIQKAYEDHAEVTFISNEDGIVLYDGINFYNTKTDEIVMNNENTDVNQLSLQSLEAAASDLTSSSASKSLVYSSYLSVQPVPIEIINGQYLHWAASIATKYNFKHGFTSTSAGWITAADVYNTLRNITGYNNPTATDDLEQQLLRWYGLPDTCSDYSMTPYDIYTNLGQRNLPLICLSSYNGPILFVNYVVLNGIWYYDDDTSMLSIVDSLEGGIFRAYVDSDASEGAWDFRYNPDGAVGQAYGSWYKTFSYI